MLCPNCGERQHARRMRCEQCATGRAAFIVNGNESAHMPAKRAAREGRKLCTYVGPSGPCKRWIRPREVLCWSHNRAAKET